MTTRLLETQSLLTPAEVAAMFRVDPKTVTRWAKAGKLTSIRTLGGHRRYREDEVLALLAGAAPATTAAKAAPAAIPAPRQPVAQRATVDLR
jgi:excisionase family DNA binding protein